MLKKIYNALNWRIRLYLLKPMLNKLYAIYVKLQSGIITDFYNSIINSKETNDINLKYKWFISKEIKEIYLKIKKIGFISELTALNTDFKISVIIPHYNRPDLLKETLDSILYQTEKPYEIIIVDDVSPSIDKVREIVNLYKDELNINLYESQVKLYTGLARQKGAEMANGEILVMNDADDPQHPQKIELLRKVININNKSVYFQVGSRQFYSNENLGEFNEKKYNIDDALIGFEAYVDRMREVFEKQLFSKKKYSNLVYRNGCFGPYGGSLHSGGVVYRKEIVPILKWESPKYLIKKGFTDWEDFEFCTYLFLLSRNGVGLNLPLYYWRRDSTTNKIWWSIN